MTYGQSLWRLVVRGTSERLFAVPHLAGLFDCYRRTTHDFLASTIVIERPRPSPTTEQASPSDSQL
ncbi:MAG TPA: hypothetical protein VEI97_09720 [bacterium]|nr:hypothetical protein [bacterium]